MEDVKELQYAKICLRILRCSKMAEEVFCKNLNSLVKLFIDTIDWLRSNGVETSLNSIVLKFGQSFVMNATPHEQITNFIDKSYEYWSVIKENNEDFLINKADILFEGVPESYIQEVKRLLSLKDGEDFMIPKNPTRKAMWRLLETLVKNSILYIHQYRSPDPIKGGYTVSYFGTVKDHDGNIVRKGISVRENALIWGIEIN